LAAALLLGAVVASGCGSTGTTVTAVTYVAVKGGSVSLGMTESPSGCNPHTPAGDTPGTRLILSGVLPSPFVVNSDGSPTPNPNLIVQSELVSTKPETIIYTLNPKAVWSDGVPILARDFIYNWQQQRANPTSGAATVSSVAGYRDISSVTGSNKGHTATVVFRSPYADWQRLFSNMVPAHIMKKVGWNPTCSTVNPAFDLSGGPFEISSVSPSSIVLKDNPRWWGVAPNVRQITVHIASSTDQLAQWIRTGFVQVASPGTTTESFLNAVTSLPDTNSEVDFSNTMLQLEFASGPQSMLSPDMRFAIALSVDRQALVNQVASFALPNVDVASSHIWAEGQTGYHPSLNALAYQASRLNVGAAVTPPTTTSTTLIGQGTNAVNFPDTPVLNQAAQLMVASGFDRTDGGPWHEDFGVPFTLHLVVDTGDPWAAAAAPVIEAQLQAAGFNITHYSVNTADQAGEVLANGFANMALLPRTNSTFLSQSLAWYTDLLGAPGQNGSQDWSDYDSSTLEQLLTTASQQLNPNTAATEYAQADTELWDEMVALPLFTEPVAMAWSNRLGGVVTTPKSDSLLWFAQYWAVRVPEAVNNTTPQLPGQSTS
jgi:peptide/nickel transport system substrate-binding protein